MTVLLSLMIVQTYCSCNSGHLFWWTNCAYNLQGFDLYFTSVHPTLSISVQTAPCSDSKSYEVSKWTRPNLSTCRTHDDYITYISDVTDNFLLFTVPCRSASSTTALTQKKIKRRGSKSMPEVKLFSDSSDAKVSLLKVKSFHCQPKLNPKAAVFHYPTAYKCLTHYQVGYW
mgnify:FL=1